MKVGAAAAMVFLLLAAGFASRDVQARPQGPGGDAPEKKDGPPGDQPKVKLGLVLNDSKSFRGYTVLNPMSQKVAYLIDNEGRVVRSWKSEYNSMHAAHLLPNGNLFRVAMVEGAERSFGGGPGTAGRVQEFDWDGNLVWDFQFVKEKQLHHHDALKIPNGNVLLVVWDKKTADEAIAAGRKKELISNYVLPDSVIEVKPTGKTTGEIVWEWHLWDHLIQDHDSSKANFGDVAAHPELVDINFVEDTLGPIIGPPPGGGPATKGGPPPTKDAGKEAAKEAARKKAEAEKLKTIGYVGSPTQRAQRINPDWTHVNSVDYNPELDQIVISVHEFSEIWVIDHSTTKAEAAGHSGGRSGKGGDLVYRWGNPRVYRAGTKADQTLFVQHNAQWIPKGMPGAGHLLIFNNGGNRPGERYSSIDEIVPPVDDQGKYTREAGTAFGPKKPVWSYSAANKADFFAFFISGTHRLPNGNTMICSGPNGTLFEVTPEKEVVWKYVNPMKGGFGPGRFGPGGPGGPGGPFRPNQVLNSMLQDMLGLSADQKKEIDAFQKTVDETLDKTLTEDQKKTLRERSTPGPGGFAGIPAPGQIISTSTQVLLKPTPEQRTRLSELQKDADAKLDRVLTDDQKKQFAQIKDFARGGFPGGGPAGGGPPGGGPPGGRPGGGPPGGPGGGPPPGLFAGPPGGSAVFRAYRYGPEFPGLAGKNLKPGKTVEELQPKDPEPTKAAVAPIEKAKEAATR
jgi:hypothetical protein